MPHYQVFDDPFTSGDVYDQIAARRQTVAAMLFFKRANGSVGGGPFFVWSSEEGEAARIIAEMPQIDMTQANLRETRRIFADWRAETRRGTPNYHQKGHAEEFLVDDFPLCCHLAAPPGSDSTFALHTAYINISKSPCVGELDAKASTNFGLARGCYNKLILLAAKTPNITFDVSFDRAFRPFENNTQGALAYMNNNRISNNISFSYNEP